MSRPLRIEYPGAWYHIMNKGRRSEKAFLESDDYQRFIDLMIEASELWSVNIPAFSLMPNHYHMLINTPLGNLSRFMRHINGVYTQRFNKAHELEGQLFKGRYKSILVNGDGYLLQLVRYIHNNPLRGDLVKNISDYRWSSHPGYIEKSEEWDWLYKKYILSIFSENREKGERKYLEFMDLEENPNMIKILGRKRWPTFLGSEEFISSIKDKFFMEKRDKEIPDSKFLAPDLELIIETICKFYNIEESSINVSKRRYFNEPRNVAIYLSRLLRNDTLEQLCGDFLLNNHSSVSSILTKIKEMMTKDQDFRVKVSEIEELIIKRQTKT